MSICNICGGHFTNARGLRVHIARAHKRPRKTPRFSCGFCGWESQNKRVWQNHYIQEHVGASYFCVTCYAGFQDRQLAVVHSQKQHSVSRGGVVKQRIVAEGWWPCLHCRRDFASIPSLHDHVVQEHRIVQPVVHREPKPEDLVPHYRCVYCGKEFPNEPDLLSHLQAVHVGSKRRRKISPCFVDLTSSESPINQSTIADKPPLPNEPPPLPQPVSTASAQQFPPYPSIQRRLLTGRLGRGRDGRPPITLRTHPHHRQPLPIPTLHPITVISPIFTTTATMTTTSPTPSQSSLSSVPDPLCVHCGEKCANLSEHDCANKMWSCGVCQSTFRTESAMVSHTFNEHSVHACQICSQVFETKDELDAHMTDNQIHVAYQPVVCGRCGKCCRNRFELNDHQKLCDLYSKCSKCSAKFLNVRAKEEHEIAQHQN